MRQWSCLFLVLLLMGPLPLRAQETGSGELLVLEQVMQHYQEFKDRFGGAYFAVSTNGRSSGYSYCRAQRCKLSTGKQVAIRSCVDAGGNQGGKCFIFANTSHIMWDGPVRVVSEAELLAR